MTLDEAIKHCEDVANAKCDSCGAEHRQLAEWLKELRLYRMASEHSQGRANYDGISRIKDITLKIAFHENKIAMHKSAIKRLRKEKSILMMNGEWEKNGKSER